MDFDLDDLAKIPRQPAARMLAAAGTRLQTPLAAPASAPVETVLRELAEQGARLDMLRLLCVALPRREAVWWACLAARDIAGPGDAPATPSIAAAEAWVFGPGADTRAAAQRAMEAADIDDDTVYCAMAAVYGDGTMGPGEMQEFEAPPNAVATAVLCMNLKSLAAAAVPAKDHMAMLIRRGLDIARGGTGRVEALAPAAAGVV